MESEEIGHDPAPRSRRSRLAVAALAALVLPGAWALHSRFTDPVAATAQPAAAPRTVPAAAPLALTDVCPLETDHQTTVTVSFVLHNPTDMPAEITRLDPVLPLGGLRLTATTTRSGSCAHPGRAVRTRGIAAGGRVLVTFRFVLPRTCPTALPVQARLTVRSAGVTTTRRFPVVNDLAGVRYDTCIPGQW